VSVPANARLTAEDGAVDCLLTGFMFSEFKE
jgi:hypothetical protein